MQCQKHSAHSWRRDTITELLGLSGGFVHYVGVLWADNVRFGTLVVHCLRHGTIAVVGVWCHMARLSATFVARPKKNYRIGVLEEKEKKKNGLP